MSRFFFHNSFWSNLFLNKFHPILRQEQLSRLHSLLLSTFPSPDFSSVPCFYSSLLLHLRWHREILAIQEGSLLDILYRRRKENPTHYQLAPLPFVGWYFRNSLRCNTIRLQVNISRKVRTTQPIVMPKQREFKSETLSFNKRKKSKKLLGSRIKKLTFRLYQISMRSCCLVWRLVSPAPTRSSHNNDTSVGPGVHVKEQSSIETSAWDGSSPVLGLLQEEVKKINQALQECIFRGYNSRRGNSACYFQILLGGIASRWKVDY